MATDSFFVVVPLVFSKKFSLAATPYTSMQAHCYTNPGYWRKMMLAFILTIEAIDLFSLYILFSHFRPRDVTLGKTFFEMSSYAREYVRITYEKTKGKFP